MSHFLTSDDKFRDLLYGDDYRAYLMARSKSAENYRFGRTQGQRVRARARTALSRANGYLKNMIEAITNAKLRRMERELRGIRFDRPNNNWVARNSARSGVRKD
jgi:hypothetical protein